MVHAALEYSLCLLGPPKSEDKSPVCMLRDWVKLILVRLEGPSLATSKLYFLSAHPATTPVQLQALSRPHTAILMACNTTHVSLGRLRRPC